MKFIAFLVALALQTQSTAAGVSRPEISVLLDSKLGDASSLGALTPTVKWDATGSFSDFDLEVR